MWWIALAAQLSMPLTERGNVLDLFSNEDVPINLIPNGEARRVNIRVTVGPDGRLRRCDIEGSSEIERLDALTCDLVRKRARFHPATWSDSSPAYAVIRKSVVWSVNARFLTAPGDLDLTVEQLPKGLKSPIALTVMFETDVIGRLGACVEETRTFHPYTKKFPELVKVACQQLSEGYVATPARDDSGKAVKSIQDAVVRFSTDSAATER